LILKKIQNIFQNSGLKKSFCKASNFILGERPMAKEKTKQQQIKVRYNETSALFASQFILNTSEEDITINFSSGPMNDPAGNETILPVHTRIAMTREGALRLRGILDQVLSSGKSKKSVTKTSQAKLPKIQ